MQEDAIFYYFVSHIHQSKYSSRHLKVQMSNRSRCQIFEPKFLTQENIPIRLYSMNIYTQQIINECVENGRFASRDSYCCSVDDPLCLLQYYTLTNIKVISASTNDATTPSRTTNIKNSIQNKPVRIFSYMDNTMIISSIENSQVLWWDWITGRFRLPQNHIKSR